MLGKRLKYGAIRSILGVAAILLILGIMVAAPSQQILAGSAGVTCNGDDLLISWNGLNANISGVTVEVNGVNVYNTPAPTGSYTVAGPGDWQVQVYQNGDPVFNSGAPISTSCPGPVAPPKSRKIPNGNDSSTNIAFRRDDGGFELYVYNVITQTGSMLFSMSCEDQRLVAVRSARLHYIEGKDANITIFSGVDAAGRKLSVYFIFPEQIQINGYFADGKPHTYSFPACVSARQVEINTPTPTPTATLNQPIISLSASCSVRGNATYRITNTGGDMLSSGNWVVVANGTRMGSDTFRVRSGGVTTITSSGLYGDITFTTSGGGTVQQTASTNCLYPTATFTRTPTNTPVPPQISLSASCSVRGNATYRITNTGGDMLSSGNWVVVANGTRMGSDTFRVRSGGVTTITSSGLYGDITFTTSGGGTVQQTASTICARPPTATFTPVR